MGGPRNGDYDVPPNGSLVGYSITPPWHISQVIQRESALRSTQSAVSLLQTHEHYPQEETPQPPSPSQVRFGQYFHPEDLHRSFGPPCPSWTPLNQPLLHRPPVDSNTFWARYDRIINDFNVNMHEYDAFTTIEDGMEESVIDKTVKRHNEDDVVYHVGHVRGQTYSGSFRNDDPDTLPEQAVHFIKQMKRKQMWPEWLKRSVKLLKDISKLIESGCLLLLQHTSFVQDNKGIICTRPGCSNDADIPPGRYYLELGNEDSKTFCLQCFERLWKGDYTNGSVNFHREEEVTCQRRDPVMAMRIPQYDGDGDAPISGLFDSRWTVPERTLDSEPKPAFTPEKNTQMPDDYVYESPGSVTTQGEWRFPPTRFQFIAASVVPGATLNKLDRAALTYWKHVSRVQLAWEAHTRSVRYVREYYDGLVEEDRSLRMAPVNPTEHEQVDEDTLEAELGLRKRDVYGTELSEVLKKVADEKY